MNINLEKIKDAIAKVVVGIILVVILGPIIIAPLVFIGYHLINYQESIRVLVEIYGIVKNNILQVGIFLLTVLVAVGVGYSVVRIVDWSFSRVIKDSDDEDKDGPKTFGEYVSVLQNFLGRHPELADKKVIYSIDTEGNAFHEIYYTPSFGEYNSKDKYFESKEGIDETVNAVCIN